MPALPADVEAPAGLVALVEGCLRKDPERRIASARTRNSVSESSEWSS